MSQPVTFRTVLVESDVIEAAIEFDFDGELNEEFAEFLKIKSMPVVWEEGLKVGVARNFILDDRGLSAELTVRHECRNCAFSLTNLKNDPKVMAYGGDAALFGVD